MEDQYFFGSNHAFFFFLVRSPHGSDTILLFQLFLVRSPHGFRHYHAFLLFLVRSPHGFRHYHAFSALPCPKSPRLQTLSRFFCSSLSEVPTASDTITLFLLFLVRSPHGFGHHLAFSSSLSEVCSASDTILLFQF